jgi:putative PIN family toxin of toxin-antitoxin system
MIRAVLDTNVLASAAIAHPGTTLATILDTVVANRFDLAISEYILVELRRTLTTPYYVTRITPAAAARYVQLLISLDTTVRITTSVQGIATHPEDDPILATALSVRADYLVTGDRRLRDRVPSFQGIPLISPSEFRDVLNREP